MNITALAIAGVGLAGAFLSLRLGRYAKNKFVGLLFQIGGIFLSFLLMVIIAQNDQTTYDAGRYFVPLLVLMLIVRSVYMKRKSRTKPDLGDSVK